MAERGVLMKPVKKIKKANYTWEVSETDRVNEPSGTAYKVTLTVPENKKRTDGFSIPGVTAGDLMVCVNAIKKGLPVSVVDDLCRELELSRSALAKRVGIPERTLMRRMQVGRLTSGQSERVVRLARLFDRTIQVLGSKERARRWLNAPRAQLDGHTPLDMADTELGAEEVTHLLGRIEHGVFS